MQRSLGAALLLEALRMALTQRRPSPIACAICFAPRHGTTEQHGIRISMSRVATPYVNAQAERFIKTLMCEGVYRTEYYSLQQASALIGEIPGDKLQPERLHSALGYRPPLEFERTLRSLPQAYPLSIPIPA